MSWYKDLVEYGIEKFQDDPEKMKCLLYKTSNFMDKVENHTETMSDMEDLHMELELMICGPHFTDFSSEKAVSEMINDDGTVGEHWTLDETTSVARTKGIDFDVKKYNIYDWYYAMNMIYSDFYSMNQGDVAKITESAYLWCEDKDAPEGKNFLYYMAMKKGKSLEKEYK